MHCQENGDIETRCSLNCQNDFGTEGQSLFYNYKVYFITWPMQNVTGELLLLSLSEVGQHLFEANINGVEAF